MPDASHRNHAQSDDTILEFSVRDRLTRQQIRDLLDSMGAPTTGNREEMAERLLGLRGLKEREVLRLLSTEDLKRVEKRFRIAGTQGGVGLLDALFGDEKKDLVDRIAKVAAKQRAPRPILDAGEGTQLQNGPRKAPPTARVPGGSGQAGESPTFQHVRDFVGAYKFSYQWDREDLYEAELLGSLRGQFGIHSAIRQQGDAGRVYDIVVRNAARIEVKLPKVKGELDRMIGQVTRYLSQHPGEVIVVIVVFQMRNQQEIHNAQEDLERAGAVVFTK